MMFLARSKSVSRTWSPAVQPVSTPSAEAIRCRAGLAVGEPVEVFLVEQPRGRAVHLEARET